MDGGKARANGKLNNSVQNNRAEGYPSFALPQAVAPILLEDSDQ